MSARHVPRLAKASAPGKVVLLGEYAVLEGAPAIVMAVSRRARAQVSLRPDVPHWEIKATPLNLTATLMRRHQQDTGPLDAFTGPTELYLAYVILSDWLEGLGAAVRGGGVLTLDTEAFYGHTGKWGLGSSAAIAVATWHALRASVPAPSAAPQALFSAQSAFDSVRLLHRLGQGGVGSGIDVAASTLGGVLRFEAERASPQPLDVACDAAAMAAQLEGRSHSDSLPPRRGTSLTTLAMPKDLTITLLWAGASAKTTDFLEAFSALKKRDARLYWQHLEELAALSHGGCEMWHLGHSTALLPLINRYHDAMVRLGLSIGKEIVTPKHHRVAQLVRDAGGAYKPSGAGGGDIGVAFSRRGLQTYKLRYRLWREGVEVLPMQCDVDGVFTEQDLTE